MAGLVCSSESLNKILSAIYTLVFLSGALVGPGNDIDEFFEVGVAEVSYRVPRRMLITSGLGRGLDDAVDGALDAVIGPACKQVSRIDHNRILDGRCVDESTIRRLDLQASAVILEEQGNRTIVGMLSRSNLSRILLEDVLVHGRVVKQAERVVAAIGILIEPGIVNAQAHRDGAHDLHVEALALLEEAQHDVLEHLALVVKAVRPLVGQAGLVVAADLEALLQVRDRGAQGLDVALLGQLRHLLAARRRVSPVRLRGRPAHRLLLLEGPLEEGRGLGEDALDVVARHAMVLDVDEAGGLETVDEGARGGLALLGGAREEETEIHKLEDCASANGQLVGTGEDRDQHWGPTGMTRLSFATALSAALGAVMLIDRAMLLCGLGKAGS
jgi:hypothetical protein